MNLDTLIDFINRKKFEAKLFLSLKKKYYRNAPESDSLYRRRNKLISFTVFFSIFLGTQHWLNHYKIYFSRNITKSISIPLIKTIYLFALLAISQLIMKYIFYLNRIYKSYQFGLEGVLKYKLMMSNNHIYHKDFDIIDSHNIKKYQ